MKMIKQAFWNLFLVSIFSLSVQMNAYAEEGAIRFTNKAYKQVATKDSGGTVSYDYVEPSLVLPKDIILYEITFENISDEAVDDIVVNTPVANNSSYRANSAMGDATEITFSVDGKTFAAANALTVKDKTGKSWQADPKDYTAIRWKYKKSLKPGAKGKVTYKTVIN